MKEITITVYISRDGVEFKTEHACLEHEKELAEFEERAEYLQENITKEFCEYFKKKDIKFEIHQDETKILYYWGDRWCEFDEDFDIDYSEWEKFKKLIRKKYGYKINTPYWYWGK
jgi:hypothetical protein